MYTRTRTIAFLSLSLALVVGVGVGVGVGFGQEEVLGKIEFPNSGPEQAQQSFLNGVRLLHSFEWEDAADAFLEVQKIAPDFALGYWGEAMSFSYGHHFSPTAQDMAKGRAALQKLGRSRAERLAKAPTAREKGYLEAIEALFGEGSPEERALAYSEAMGRLSQEFPDDLEAAAFYSLSLMRTKIRGAESLREDVQAGAIAQRIFRENPDHPGAAHYIIHAYDDPVHAPIALYAAHKYSEIAPAAVHALHMPSHIFVQHGMWNHVARRNDASYSASVERAKRKGLSPTRHSFHALYWLQYAYLQQGRYDDAAKAIEEIRTIANREDATQGVRNTLLRMESLQTVEAQQWRVRDVETVLEQIRGDAEIDERTAGAALFASGMSGAKTSDLEAANKSLEGLKELVERMGDEDRNATNQVETMRLEIEALIAMATGDADGAIEAMKEATAIAESMEPPSGPPGEAATDAPIKPPHELFGEILMAEGKHQEALAQFETSLLRTPNRVRSLLGAARAAEEVGNEKIARRSYESIAHIAGAGPDLPGLAEARKYVETSENE